MRITLGLLLILFLLGQTLIVFPAKDDLDPIKYGALSFQSSIAVVPLMGLMVNYMSFEVVLVPVLVTLSTFTILLSFFALFRRRWSPEDHGFSADLKSHFEVLRELFKTENRLDHILTVILIISIILAISLTAYLIVTPEEGERFTEFYILGPNGTASDYPTDLKAGEEGEVIIGVVNHEYANVSYRLEVKLNGEVISEKSIRLMHNETWEHPFTFRVKKAGKNQKLEFLLYREGLKDVYRSLHLWVNVKG